MRAADVMVRNVVTVRPETAVPEAAKLLVDHDVSALPVVDAEGRVVGMLSEADLMRREEIGTEKRRRWWLEAVTPGATLAEEYAKSHGKTVEELMSREVISATEDTTLADIASLFEKHSIKRVPIITDGKLVGIVSRANLVQAVAAASVPSARPGHSDRRIRLDILARLAEQSWTDFGDRNIIVVDGTAHIWGLVGSPQERKALTSLVEDVPGVTAVKDEMIPAYQRPSSPQHWP